MRLLFFLLIPFLSLAQSAQQPDAAKIRLKLKKLNFLGSVLYMAAHPDDENTNVIAYLSNERLAETAYLSLTRGDGGQNLIGPEIRDRLGVIRTQELLAARSIDGGKQFFTRAIDFGYSKSPEEAFAIWGKQEVTSDVVKIFRQFQPDVIITRFPPNSQAGHGHHTASAILAGEAFELAARKDVFPDQVEKFGTWKPKRLYTNTGRWWNQTVNESTPGVITLNVGGYNPLLGQSYTEISALSSSQHKSQGWGRAGRRGYSQEFLEHVKGEQATRNIFEGVDTTWSRVKGGSHIAAMVENIIANFKPEDPSATVELLLGLRKEIRKLPAGVWRERKLAEVEELVIDCLGLFAEAAANTHLSSPADKVKVDLEIVNRASYPVTISRIYSKTLRWDSTLNAKVPADRPSFVTLTSTIEDSAPYSGPYWLQHAHGEGLYRVDQEERIGLPQSSPAVLFNIELTMNGEKVNVTRPLIFKWVDPVKGELRRPFEIVPPVSVSMADPVYVFGSGREQQVRVLIKSHDDKNHEGTVRLELPKGWKSESADPRFRLSGKQMEQSILYTITPPPNSSEGEMRAIARVNGKDYDHALEVISYDHFPAQTLLPPSMAKVVRIDLKKHGSHVGYIKGAGDDIPSALRNMGYEVWEMENEEITLQNLKRLDAVVLGVRALNTNERAPYFMQEVLDYVKQGGTAIVQYNTNARLETEKFSPFPISIGRERVTDETAEVRILRPNHPVMNVPNKITSADFSGWVQERGLYFPSKWDDNYDAILSMNDKGEDPRNGSLLITPFGEGHYIYTGISFFRQLPEGVPGAYKLFANMVSLGNDQSAESRKDGSR